MIEIQRADALDRTGALVFGCANMLYISPCERSSVFMCVCLRMCVCTVLYVCRRECVLVCAQISSCVYIYIYMDSMIYFQAICSKVRMAFNLVPLRRSQEKKNHS